MYHRGISWSVGIQYIASTRPSVGRNRPTIIAHRDFYAIFWERIGPMLVERTGGVLNLTPHFLISSGIIAIDQAAVPIAMSEMGSFNASYNMYRIFTIVACV
jgi:hypothetical protein